MAHGKAPDGDAPLGAGKFWHTAAARFPKKLKVERVGGGDDDLVACMGKMARDSVQMAFCTPTRRPVTLNEMENSQDDLNAAYTSSSDRIFLILPYSQKIARLCLCKQTCAFAASKGAGYQLMFRSLGLVSQDYWLSPPNKWNVYLEEVT
jgi:hypothetical protein